MDNDQILEATKNMNPEAREMFILTQRVMKLETSNTELKNKVNDIRIEQNRLNTLLKQYADLKEKVDKQSKKIYDIDEKFCKLGNRVVALEENKTSQPKTWLNRILRR